LDGYYNEAASILREIGFRELTQIGMEGRRQVPLQPGPD
jgi:hypothetical protein